MIDADVTELIARVPLPAGADMLEVVLRQLERIFLEDSGLAEGRPGVRVSVSRPAHYLELLENIQVHGYHATGSHHLPVDEKWAGSTGASALKIRGRNGQRSISAAKRM
jgi:hypothetical protein